MKRISLSERFWSKVMKTSTCWIWQAQIDKDGYGRFQINNKAFRAHRVAYTLTHGETDVALAIDQSCKNRLCMNPSHLKTVSRKQGYNRRFPVKLQDDLYCAKGHPYLARVCKDCKNELDSRWKA